MIKLRYLITAFTLCTMSWAPARAACSVPYTFVSGTTADAAQVNQNFWAVLNCTNALPAETDGTFTPVDASGADGGVSQSFATDVLTNTSTHKQHYQCH